MSQFTQKDMTRGDSFSASFSYLSEFIADAAVSALLAEVTASPKPGLVDSVNNGAHTDMTWQTFADSAHALRSYFLQCAEAGETYRQDLTSLAPALRSFGMQAETAMYAATGGVNTHKGAIFSMGILCAAVSAEGSADLSEIRKRCRSIAGALLEKDTASCTHGLAVREKTGVGGIRQEALAGFPSAFEIGFPALERALSGAEKASDGTADRPLSFNDALIYALLSIMSRTGDSNLVHRGGVEGMDFAQKEAKRLTESGPQSLDLEAVEALDREFIKRNLSPGGSADMLAFSAMLYYIKKGNNND